MSPPETHAEHEEHHLRLRNLRREDFDAVKAIMDDVYSRLGGAWTRQQYRSLLSRFPEGQIGIEDHGEVVAAALTICVDYERLGDFHTYAQVTDDGNFATHDPNGDVLYGVDIFVRRDYRGMRLGRRLYDARKALCQRLNKRAIIAGGRMPAYAEHADALTSSQYIDKVKSHELFDPVLSFQLANDFHVRRVITGYLPDDQASRGYATIIEWSNIYHQPQRPPLIGAPKRVVRVGTVQWQMRRVAGFEELIQQVEFFVDALAGYNCDIGLFPELFDAPLLGQFEQDNPAEAMRELADYTAPLRDAFSDLAVSYNINLVAGSLPEYDGERLLNVAYLCRRDGSVEAQHKLHITPDEQHWWGIRGGDALRALDTDVGKIGVLVCYDVEFPELSRLLADQGMRILFVPFWTDTKNGYLRVRRCAQARAIENECYVAITGSVGNLPRVENADIQYSQAAVFSPSDFAFPHDAVMAESTPNTEMTLIVDLDMDKLTALRHTGSVRNLKDRRLDLYRVLWQEEQ